MTNEMNNVAGADQVFPRKGNEAQREPDSYQCESADDIGLSAKLQTLRGGFTPCDGRLCTRQGRSRQYRRNRYALCKPIP